MQLTKLYATTHHYFHHAQNINIKDVVMGGSRQDSDDKCGIHFHWAGGYQAGVLKLRLLRKLCAVWGNEVYAGSDVSINIYQYILTFFNIIDNLDDALLEESYYTAVLKLHQFAKFFQFFAGK